MAFPTSPTNGQIVVVNNVSYQYSNVSNSWTRILSTANIITANTLVSNGYISAAGNISTGNYFIGNGSLLTGITLNPGNIANGTSNVTIVSSGGNATVNIGGTSNVAVFATTGEYVTGIVSASGNIISAGNVTGGNIVTAGLISAGGTLSVTGATTLGTASTGNLSAGNVTTGGLVSAAGNITGGNVLTGGVISATGNIVSANNIIASKVVTANDNIVINSTGVEGGQLVLAWANVNGLIAQGNSTWNLDTDAGNNFRLFYQNGAAATSVLLSVSPSTNVVSFPNSAGISATGNISGANLLTGGLVSAVANITGGNILTVGQISATGTITSNGVTNGTAFAVGNGAVSNVALGMFPTAGTSGEYAIRDYSNVATNLYLDVGMGGTANGAFQFRTSNAFRQLANINSTGINTPLAISATGNVTGSYFIGNGSQLTGIVASAGTSIVNGTSNVVVAASGNVTVGVAGTPAVATFYTGGIIANSIAATSNGNGTNFKVGDDAWIGDINVADTMSIRGQQSALNGYIVFGNADGTQLGRAGSGPLTYGGAFSATGNISGGNLITAGLISSTGTVTGSSHLGSVVSVTANVTGGNLLTGGLISATSTITSAANITGGNLLTAGLVSATGTVTGSSFLGSVVSVTANVTSGNILTGGLISATSTITSSANITGGNLLTGGLASVTGNVIAGNVNTATVRPTSGALTLSTASGAINLNPAGNIVLSANTYINNLNSPVQDADAATKAYVDNFAAQGISYHSPVSAATTTTLATTTGGTITYTQPNGASNGIGAYLSTTGSFNLIDTVNVQTAGTRILVKNEGNAVYNGVYTWSNATAIVRSTDTDEYGANSSEQLSLNDYFFVSNGNVNIGSAYVVSAPTGTITFGTSNITFAQFSSSQVYTANTSAGLSLTGTVFSAKVDNTTTAFDGTGNIIVKASANLTTPNIGAATGTSLSVTGNLTGGNLNTGGVITATGNVTGGNILTGGLISAASTITGTSHLGSVVSVTANVTGGNILTGGLISATGNITGGNITISGSANISTFLGNVFFGSVPAQPTYYTIAPLNLNNSLAAATKVQLNLINTGGGAGAGSAIDFYTYQISVAAANAEARIAGIDDGNYSAYLSLQTKTPGSVGTNGLVERVKIDSTGASVVGNVTGGNILTGGLISATSTITSAANITSGNLITAGILTATGNVISVANVIGGNITTAGVVTATGNITGGNILTGGLVSATANVIGGNLTTVGQISATGNITGNYYIGNGAFLTGLNAGAASQIANGATTISIPQASGNIAMNVAGASNTVVINLGSLTMYGTFAGPKNLAANVAVASNVNALLLGPVTLASGYNITVPDSSTLYVFAP